MNKKRMNVEHCIESFLSYSYLEYFDLSFFWRRGLRLNILGRIPGTRDSCSTVGCVIFYFLVLKKRYMISLGLSRERKKHREG
jgi:hypothetical protein